LKATGLTVKRLPASTHAANPSIPFALLTGPIVAFNSQKPGGINMGGVRAEFDKSHWDSLPAQRKIEALIGWVVVEVDHRQVIGISLTKQTIEKLSPKEKEELTKRGIKIYPSEVPVTDEQLFKIPEEKKKAKETPISPQDIAKRMGKDLMGIKKEDYAALSEPQRVANANFRTKLYTFHGTDEFIPESQVLVNAFLAESRRQEEAKARRVPMPPINDWLVSVLVKN
jgi:hypothetical protein